MTQLKRKNNLFLKLTASLKGESYLIINIVLAGVIVLVLTYSGIYSPDKDNYPVVCVHEKLTGQPCFSCGLSHSFSLIIRGRIDEAYAWNRYGMQVFIFFISQLLLRVCFSVFYIKNPGIQKQIVILDIGGSVLIFLIAFGPFLINLVRSVVEVI
jgi:hypothetical protein